MIKRAFIVFVLAMAMVSCNNKSGTLLAELNGKKLYLNDLSDLLSTELSSTDSANIISTYTTAWVRKQLLLQKADELLSKEKKNVDAEIDNYRSSLLIYRLEQEYVAQKADTLISQQEIEDVYAANKNMFISSSALVKAKYIKIQSAAPEVENIQKKYKSLLKDDINLVDSLCLLYAEKFDYFDNNWLSIVDLHKLLPASITINELEQLLKKTKTYETQDEIYSYFIVLTQTLPQGSISPLEIELNNIKLMIQNKRNRKLMKDLEEDLYNTAIHTNQAKIYINNKDR